MSKTHRVCLVTGGSGTLGSQISFAHRLDKNKLDVLDEKSIERAIDFYKPKALIHTAVLIDMGMCEAFPEKAYELNTIGTFKVAKVCKEKKVKMVYFSTCAVFKGDKKTPYNENDNPCPINIHGRTKHLGEIIVSDLNKDALILRTSWLFGNPNTSKGFVNYCIKRLKNKQEIEAGKDRFGSPTYIKDLIEETKKLIEEDASGIFHVVNTGCISYFELAQRIKKTGDFSSGIKPVKVSLIQDNQVNRGPMEALKSNRITLRRWDEALDEYIKTITN